MGAPYGVDAESARFLRRANLVLLTAWLILVTLGLGLLVAGKGYAFVPFVLLIVLTVVWNVYFVLWRRRREREHRSGGSTMTMVAVRDQRTGRFVTVDDGRKPVPRRWARGLRAMLVSTPFSAESSASVPEVQQHLAEAAEAKGATYSWRPITNGVSVDIAIHPRNIRNRIFMIASGELSSEAMTSFTGSIRPDAQMRIIGGGPILAFLLGGAAALIGAFIGLFFASSDKAVCLFLMLWGLVGCTASASSIWSFAKAYEAHLQLLRTVFGDGVRIG